MGEPKLQRKSEHYYRMAKQEGYRSRASFKLIQLNRQQGLFKRGDVVVDLGAAPGGWLQVASDIVGEDGFVLGIDIQPIAKIARENVRTLIGDITLEATPGLILVNLPCPANAVLSDTSPKISGVWSVDHARSVELANAALSVAERVLEKGGNALIKVFQGEFFNDFVKKAKNNFEFVKITKPPASRKGSAEVYVIAKGFRGPAWSRA